LEKYLGSARDDTAYIVRGDLDSTATETCRRSDGGIENVNRLQAEWGVSDDEFSASTEAEIIRKMDDLKGGKDTPRIFSVFGTPEKCVIGR